MPVLDGVRHEDAQRSSKEVRQVVELLGRRLQVVFRRDIRSCFRCHIR